MDSKDIARQLNLLGELLLIMDDHFLGMLDAPTQDKVLEIIIKYDPDQEEVGNEQLH